MNILITIIERLLFLANLLKLKKKKVSLTAIIKVLCKYYLINLKARKSKRQISRSSSSDDSDSDLKVYMVTNL